MSTKVTEKIPKPVAADYLAAYDKQFETLNKQQ